MADETMGRLERRLRRRGRYRVPLVGTAVVIAYMAGLTNQRLDSWWNTTIAHQGQGIGGAALSILHMSAWQVTPQHLPGESSHTATFIWLGMVAFGTIVGLGVLLLLMALIRGVDTRRGRVTLFLGAWGATILAGAIASTVQALLLRAATPQLPSAAATAANTAASVGSASGATALPTAATTPSMGTLFFQAVGGGMEFGMMIGVLVAAGAVLAYGRPKVKSQTGNVADTGDTAPLPSLRPRTVHPDDTMDDLEAVTWFDMPLESRPYARVDGYSFDR